MHTGISSGLEMKPPLGQDAAADQHPTATAFFSFDTIFVN